MLELLKRFTQAGGAVIVTSYDPQVANALGAKILTLYCDIDAPVRCIAVLSKLTKCPSGVLIAATLPNEGSLTRPSRVAPI